VGSRNGGSKEQHVSSASCFTCLEINTKRMSKEGRNNKIQEDIYRKEDLSPRFSNDAV
jgi:hypothetical protein